MTATKLFVFAVAILGGGCKRAQLAGLAGKADTKKKSNYMKHFTSGSSAKLITLSDVTCGDFAEGRATVV
jgi:hypothetical protein